jgi:hypothetical protein
LYEYKCVDCEIEEEEGKDGIQESSGVGEKMFPCVSTTIVPLAAPRQFNFPEDLSLGGLTALTAVLFFVEVELVLD